VANEYIGQLEFLVQITDQLQNRRLDRKVETGGWFVENHQARFQNQNPGKADTSLLTSGQFVRITIEECAVQPDRFEHRINALRALDCGGLSVDDQGFVQCIADPPPGVERGARVLMDILNVAAGLAGVDGRQFGDMLAVKADLPRGLTQGSQQGLGEG